MLHFQATREIQTQRQEVHCGSHTFIPISRMRKKQTAVTHSSAESDIIALAPGLRIDGSSALQFGDCVLGIVYLDQLMMFRPTFPTAHTQPNYTCSNTMRQ